MVRTPESAIFAAEHQYTCPKGLCLGETRQWYGLPPDADDDDKNGIVDGSCAFQEWLSIPASYKHVIADPMAIPRGALVFWACVRHKWGHIALALGDGKARTTWGTVVLTLNISYINTRGYTLLGWTDYLCDTPIEGIKPVAPKEDILMKLPTLKWSKQSTKVDQWTKVVQGLLQAHGYYLMFKIDGRRGSGSVKEFARFQINHNCGDGKGNADKIVGPKSWESLLTGKKW